jgi:hypothetical protein
MKRWAVVMTVVIELALPGMALAADPRFPDWPCNQVKVPEISVAAVWAGPAIDDVSNAWEEDAATKDLVARLAARRTPHAAPGRAEGDFRCHHWHRIRAAEKGETAICWIVQEPQR